MAKTTRAPRSTNTNTKTKTKKKQNSSRLLGLPQFNRPMQLIAFAAVFGILGIILNYFVNADPKIPAKNQAVFMYRTGHNHTIYEADFSDLSYPVVLYENGLMVCGQTDHSVPKQATLSKSQIKEFADQVNARGFADVEANKHFKDDSILVDPAELMSTIYLHSGKGKAVYHTSGEKPEVFSNIESFVTSYCANNAKQDLETDEYAVESVPSDERAAKIEPERRGGLEASSRAQLKTVDKPEVGAAVRNSEDQTLLQSRNVEKRVAQELMRGLNGNKAGRIEHEGKSYDVRIYPIIPEYHLRDVQGESEEAAGSNGKVYAGAARTVEFVWFYPSDKSPASNASTLLTSTSQAVRSFYKSKINENVISGGNRVMRGAKTMAFYETCPSGKTCSDKTLAAFYNVQAELQRTDAQVVVLFQGSHTTCNGWGSGSGGTANLGDNQAGSATSGLGTINVTGCNWNDGREKVSAHELGHGLGSGHWCSSNNLMSGCTPANTLGKALLNSTQKNTWRNNSWFFSTSSSNLSLGEHMYGDAILRSPQNKYQLRMQQSDGNLVIYEMATGRAAWNSRTAGYAGSKAIFQGDGNLVVYKTNGTACSSRTGSRGGNRLAMQDDGNLVIYTSSGSAIWSSKYNTWYC